jgi:hypothetical protein
MRILANVVQCWAEMAGAEAEMIATAAGQALEY